VPRTRVIRRAVEAQFLPKETTGPGFVGFSVTKLILSRPICKRLTGVVEIDPPDRNEIRSCGTVHFQSARAVRAPRRENQIRVSTVWSE